ncbi:MAG: hypothetical protein KGK44_10880 [Gammaproteobacteria bacterium]|nr:hypothetical protein [Gammaproteobacteria bacterium]
MQQPITVSESILGSLKDTSPWVKFLAIVCFVVSAFVFLGGVITVAGFALGHETSPLRAVLGPIAGIVEIISAAFFYLIPGIFLLRYGNAILAIQATGQAAMEDALRQQKTLWKYVGIFTIVLLVCYVLMIIGLIIFAIIYGSISHQ